MIKVKEDNAVTSGKQHIAYFSLEYGIHESVRLYSGGLGCLAGDHLKSASDLNLPMVAVGLLYRQGYFQQYLNDDGWQQESYLENEVHRLPLSPVLDAAGNPLKIAIPLPGDTMHALVWRLEVGSLPLFLLDTNIADNTAHVRQITARLYEADRTLRLRQEILLGIGGVEVLEKLGYDPGVFHMNEGHAAFLALARIARFMKSEGLTYDEALEFVYRTGVFTTHTPVPAGNETFDVNLVKSHLDALQAHLGVDTKTVLSLGFDSYESAKHEYSMTVMALRTSHLSNGVSRLHGAVARKMWAHLWPDRPVDEVPIRHVTNGVHVQSWLSTELAMLFDKYIGQEWRSDPSAEAVVHGVDNIPDDALWRAHQSGRSRLVRWSRVKVEQQCSVRSASQTEIRQIKSALNFDALTIGFARRFATYKRATMLLRDEARLEAILRHSDYPVQFLFAGKAHPADNEGKDLIRRIVDFGRRTGLRDRFIFLENYNILIARHLVQGVDIWLNNPRRPLEASGTSGMKAALNGGLHVSTLDGWWDEGYTPDCGWAIGNGEEHEHHEFQDHVEAQALYNLLENEIVPCFYNRPDSDMPARWIFMMKESIKSALKHFSSHRMVAEYADVFYSEATEADTALRKDGYARTKSLVEKRKMLNDKWHLVKAMTPETDRDITALHVGDSFTVSSRVVLGDLKAEDVDVEVYHGPVDSQNRIIESHSKCMELVSAGENGESVFRQTVTCAAPGRYGYTVRVTPRGEEWKSATPGYVVWAG